MDNRFKGRIKTALRRLSWAYTPYKTVKAKAKVDKSTWECTGCGAYVYTGKSEKNFTELCKKYPELEVKQGKVNVDHILPVEDPELGWVDWNTFMSRLYCKEDNLQLLCTNCHDIKSASEQKKRRKKK